MSDIANAIMDDLWANGFVPGDKVLQILAKHITPLEQEVGRLRAAAEIFRDCGFPPVGCEEKWKRAVSLLEGE